MSLLYQNAFHQPIGITLLNGGFLYIIFGSLATVFCHLERGFGFRKEKIVSSTKKSEKKQIETSDIL